MLRATGNGMVSDFMRPNSENIIINIINKEGRNLDPKTKVNDKRTSK
jgi:hypothetical protein